MSSIGWQNGICESSSQVYITCVKVTQMFDTAHSYTHQDQALFQSEGLFFVCLYADLCLSYGKYIPHGVLVYIKHGVRMG